MITITTDYHTKSDTYISKDIYGNQITFKSDREKNIEAIESQGTTIGPMISLLMACGACSAIDIVMILDKQRQNYDTIRVIVKGEREQNQTPALWKNIEVIYEVSGNVDESKAIKAAELSVEKYCSVLETLRRAGAQIQYQVKLNA